MAFKIRDLMINVAAFEPGGPGGTAQPLHFADCGKETTHPDPGCGKETTHPVAPCADFCSKETTHPPDPGCGKETTHAEKQHLLDGAAAACRELTAIRAQLREALA